MSFANQPEDPHPNEELGDQKKDRVEAAFLPVRAVGTLGYTGANGYFVRQELFLRLAMGLDHGEVLGATGVNHGSEHSGTESTFSMVTERLLVRVMTSEPELNTSFERQTSELKYHGPVLVPISCLTQLEVTLLTFDVFGVPDIEFNAYFEGVEEPVAFTQSLNQDGEARRRVYYFLRRLLAARA